MLSVSPSHNAIESAFAASGTQRSRIGHLICIVLITLSTDNPSALTIPPCLYIAPGQISGSVSITPAKGIRTTVNLQASYQNRTVTNTYTTPNPLPTLKSVTPKFIQVDSADTTLILTGTSFNTTSVVDWNGSPLTTTYVSPTQLTAVAPASLLTKATTAKITVTNPAPGGGMSTALTVKVGLPALALKAVTVTRNADGSLTVMGQVADTNTLTASPV